MEIVELTGRTYEFIAFEGFRCVGKGSISKLAVQAKEALDRGDEPVLIFDTQTSELVEIDFRGELKDVLERLASGEKVDRLGEKIESDDLARRPGRPKLGVVAREVTLLPRHWEWLNKQTGGASVALRKLIDEARKTSSSRDRVRHSQEVTYKFMSAIAGNLAGFEEASRGLFSSDRQKFEEQIKDWPADIQQHCKVSAVEAFGLPPIREGE